MATQTYVVEGMSCGHCEAAVREEVCGVEGVEDVRVDLTTGHLTVVGTSIDEAAVKAAVEEAGYRVAA